MTKEFSASAKSLSESRECFIEVYIDNRCLIIIVYLSCCLGCLTDKKEVVEMDVHIGQMFMSLSSLKSSSANWVLVHVEH